jgi:hypothetical protein
MIHNSIRFAAIAILAAGAVAAQAAPVAGEKLVCGGVGTDARRDLAAQMPDSNVSLEFSLAGRGNYVADVEVTLTSSAGGAAAFTVKTEGPICYLHLPPGGYRIDAAYKGTTKSATANVAAAGKPLRFAMAFPPGAADIDPAPVSAEEKLQASKP